MPTTLQSTQVHGTNEKPDPKRIRSEGREAFYRALGARLVALQGISERQERRGLLQALVDQCLKLGPHGIDAAVFVLACEDGSLGISEADYSDYEKRLTQKRDLRVTLIPTLINLDRRTSKV
ncbi:MAG: hypothetical protein ABSF87_13735 [Xanthobacteraceae bacterium]|jgi:hypothetical protein